MVLNYIWIGFFLVAFVVAAARLLTGDVGAFPELVDATFSASRTAFEIALGLTGALSFWLGVMRVGERAGVTALLARWLGPLFSKLFPDIPQGHPVTGSIFMNLAANLLGLDNAATPLGLKAMEGLQALNERKDTASDAMVMFLVLNTSGLTLIPVSILVYRVQAGAAQPADVFVPILLATLASTVAGVAAVSLRQRVRLLSRPVLLFLGGVSLLVAGVAWLSAKLTRAELDAGSTTVANVLLFGIISAFIAAGARKRINVYEAFVDGAKEGFSTAVRIIPYLVAVLAGVGVFRASGAMGFLTDGLARGLEWCGLGGDIAGALPTALMKPLSGSGARGLMVDAMASYGPDSFAGRLACIFQGSTDTTFYILAVYFGSVGIRRTRHAVPCGLAADGAGIVAAVVVACLFFGTA